MYCPKVLLRGHKRIWKGKAEESVWSDVLEDGPYTEQWILLVRSGSYEHYKGKDPKTKKFIKFDSIDLWERLNGAKTKKDNIA